MKKYLSALLCLLLVLSCFGTPVMAEEYTQAQIYEKLVAMESQYPEGSQWDAFSAHTFSGFKAYNTTATGKGCIGFAYLLSDAAFAEAPARYIAKDQSLNYHGFPTTFVGNITLDLLRVGDIIRFRENAHHVVVLEVRSDHIVVAEGNYNQSVHWYREISAQEILDGAQYILTRYPENPPAATIAGSFVDVNATHYFYDSVLYAAQMGITSGTDETHFSPMNDCLREHVVTFLWRSCGCPPVTTAVEMPFVDVSPDSYYYDAVLWALEQGITSGTDETHFSPQAPCTRAQVATFMWRAWGEQDSLSGGNPFVDVDSSAYYYTPVLWAAEYGITTGTDASHFSPDATCNRAQIVTFLYRFANIPAP